MKRAGVGRVTWTVGNLKCVIELKIVEGKC